MLRSGTGLWFARTRERARFPANPRGRLLSGGDFRCCALADRQPRASEATWTRIRAGGKRHGAGCPRDLARKGHAANGLHLIRRRRGMLRFAVPGSGQAIFVHGTRLASAELAMLRTSEATGLEEASGGGKNQSLQLLGIVALRGGGSTARTELANWRNSALASIRRGWK